MPQPAPRRLRISWVTVFGLTSSAALAGAIAALLLSPNARAQSPVPSAFHSLQVVPEWQKDAGGKMEFEVASVHPAGPDARWQGNIDLSVEDSPVPPGGIFSATTTLGGLIQFAYKLPLFERENDKSFAHQPKWAAEEFFTVEAKAPTAEATKDQYRLMVQSLLADRFKLAAHLESQDRPAMALVLVKPGKFGPGLRPHSQGPACDAKIPPVNRNSQKIPDVWIPICGTTQMLDWANRTVLLGSRNTTMEIFATYIYLIEPLDRPVVDQTGLTGGFDIELNFTPDWVKAKEQRSDAQLDLTGPTFLEALKDQLGMKLVSTRAPVQTLVVDHIEQPSPN